ncbi:hypothetical protein [Halochromatium sp.]
MLIRSAQVRLLAGLMLCSQLAPAQTIDAERLDQISVDMPRAEVHALLGPPDSVAELEPDLSAELYPLEAQEPLRAKGLLYGDSGELIGYVMLFEGEFGPRLVELLLERGYRQQDAPQGADGWWLSGYDDDTGEAQILHIAVDSPLTILTTFARDFFLERAP